VANLAFVRKPKDPNVIDLSVFGRLMTLEVKSVYFHDEIGVHFPTNIYLASR